MRRRLPAARTLSWTRPGLGFGPARQPLRVRPCPSPWARAGRPAASHPPTLAAINSGAGRHPVSPPSQEGTNKSRAAPPFLRAQSFDPISQRRKPPPPRRVPPPLLPYILCSARERTARTPAAPSSAPSPLGGVLPRSLLLVSSRRRRRPHSYKREFFLLACATLTPPVPSVSARARQGGATAAVYCANRIRVGSGLLGKGPAMEDLYSVLLPCLLGALRNICRSLLGGTQR